MVVVFADHFRGVPAAMSCPGCGHRFAADDITGDCPTNTVVRRLLQRRQHENPAALIGLPPDAFDNLRHTKPNVLRANTSAALLPATGDLFDPTPYRRYGGAR